jgi:DNA-directed RNA polymerase specialized sigma subunit
MTAKEYLQQYRNADREINAKLDQIRRLRELATKTTSVFNPDKVQTSSENKIEGIVQKIVDMEREIDADIDQLNEVKKQVQGTIQDLPDHRQRDILYMRYLNGKRWEEIAVILNYDFRYVLKLHGQALYEIKKRTLKDT